MRNLVICIKIGLASQSPILRCAAAEALGRTAQVVGDAKFVAEMAQFSFDKFVESIQLIRHSRGSFNGIFHAMLLG